MYIILDFIAILDLYAASRANVVYQDAVDDIFDTLDLLDN